MIKAGVDVVTLWLRWLLVSSAFFPTMSSDSIRNVTDVPFTRSRTANRGLKEVLYKDLLMSSPSNGANISTSQKTALLLATSIKDLDQKFVTLTKFVQPLLKDCQEQKFNHIIKDIKSAVSICLSNAHQAQVDGSAVTKEYNQIKDTLTSLTDVVKNNNSMVKAIYDKA